MANEPPTTSTGHSCFAGRFPAGAEHPVTLSKNGVRHTQRMPDGSTREVLAVGLACSECFSGPNLAKLLAPGYEYEGRVMKALAQGQPAPPLSIHTSSGVPDALQGFLQALQVHLPWSNKEELDWCVSLQIEGASAVWAAIDMVLQVSMFEGSHDENRVKVAVGATSYHGPPSTCFGSKSPLWHKHYQLIYPVPTAYGSYDEEELLQKYQGFLDKHAHEIGVMLFEPQWGSSQAALPWPEHLLKKYIGMARERGIKIICDEIMCGLGRHGKGTLFISEAWDLDPDCVTFGKAIATGVFQMSGAIMKQGRKLLHSKKCSVLQSHTYAGSSTRALLAATAVLEEFVHHLPHVAQLGQEMNRILSQMGPNSNGLFICHGQGLMWGGIITYEGQCREEEYRNRVVQSFKKHCEDLCIIPYFVPVGGFMVSPVMDIDVGTVHEIGARLEQAVHRVVDEVAWAVEEGARATAASEATKPFLAPPIASASTINLVELALQEESHNSVIKEMDLAYDKVVPHFHDVNQ